MTVQDSSNSRLSQQPMQQPGAPPVSKGTTHSPVDLAMALGLALSDMVSGKGLEKTLADTPENKAINAAIIEKNEALQKEQSLKATADITQLTTDLKQAFLIISNPALKGSDEELAAKALIEIVVAGKTSIAGHDQTSPHEYNAFLSGIVSIALLEAMMEFMKTQQVGEKIASNMWLETKGVVEDLTAAIAQNIKDKAKAEAIEHIVQAACSAGAMCAQLGGGYAGLKAQNMSKAQAANLMGQAGGTFFTGVVQNVALAPLAIYKGNLDAAKIFLEMQKDFATTMMQKQKEMGDDYSKNFSDFNDALKQWLSKLSEIGNKLTAH